MQKQRQQRDSLLWMLWSGFLALWRDRTRRPALPLLLASVLLLMPSLPARSNCCCDDENQSHEIAHRHEAKAHGHSESEATALATPRESVAKSQRHIVSPARSALEENSVPQGAIMVCCPCPRAPSSAVVVAEPRIADSYRTLANGQALTYALHRTTLAANASVPVVSPGRAGPPDRVKPESIFFASLSGRAPPVSI